MGVYSANQEERQLWFWNSLKKTQQWKLWSSVSKIQKKKGSFMSWLYWSEKSVKNHRICYFGSQKDLWRRCRLKSINTLFLHKLFLGEQFLCDDNSLSSSKCDDTSSDTEVFEEVVKKEIFYNKNRMSTAVLEDFRSVDVCNNCFNNLIF